jgi:hypothetical protein
MHTARVRCVIALLRVADRRSVVRQGSALCHHLPMRVPEHDGLGRPTTTPQLQGVAPDDPTARLAQLATMPISPRS